MADVLALLAVAVIVMGGGVALMAVTRTTRRRAAEARRDKPRRLSADLRDTDKYIDHVNNALSEDDLDSLENNRKRNP